MRILAVLVCLLVWTAPAFAADANTIDFSPVVQWAMAVLAGIAVPLSAYIVSWLERRLRVQKGSAMADIINNAVQRGGGIAYSALAAAVAKGVPLFTSKNDAVSAGVNHVTASIPDTLKAFNITPETLTRMVAGELGKLQAADPSVSSVPVVVAPKAV